VRKRVDRDNRGVLESRAHHPGKLVSLPIEAPIWHRFYLVAPLVLVGTKEGAGYDLAPKHMAMPLGWQNYYCFACSPRHGTYRNVAEHGAFTVSFPPPDRIVEASLAAGGRVQDGSKPSLAALPTFPASAVDGVLVEGCLLYLECVLDRIVDGFGENSLIVGRVVAAAAPEEALRSEELDDADLIRREPLLAYLSPGRFAIVQESRSFPFAIDMRL
jgi:flavin reductase (DIM6/NTAB) family NADH-FMN oxidoreductase RutF